MGLWRQLTELKTERYTGGSVMPGQWSCNRALYRCMGLCRQLTELETERYTGWSLSTASLPELETERIQVSLCRPLNEFGTEWIQVGLCRLLTEIKTEYHTCGSLMTGLWSWNRALYRWVFVGRQLSWKQRIQVGLWRQPTELAIVS